MFLRGKNYTIRFLMYLIKIYAGHDEYLYFNLGHVYLKSTFWVCLRMEGEGGVWYMRLLIGFSNWSIKFKKWRIKAIEYKHLYIVDKDNHLPPIYFCINQTKIFTGVSITEFFAEILHSHVHFN